MSHLRILTKVERPEDAAAEGVRAIPVGSIESRRARDNR